jgi:hypothetical protein
MHGKYPAGLQCNEKGRPAAVLNFGTGMPSLEGAPR